VTPAPRATVKRIDGNSIIRFDVQQRVQHTLMFCSFGVLAVTGLPLKYSAWGSSQWWMGVWGGIDAVRAVHRYAAWVMIGTFVYHLMYLLLKRPFSAAMLPRAKDFGDFVQDMRHTFDSSAERPKFDRFSYRNKFAYWLLLPGAIFMVGTGLLLMYPVWTANHSAKWTYLLALTIHGDAAIFAIGWMTFAHVYFAHFAEHVFPIDKSIFTGRVPIERYQEEFPLEYAKIMAAVGAPMAAPEYLTPPAGEEHPHAVGPLPEKESVASESQLSRRNTPEDL
jgi:formate dehydrogenase subunit gamma